MPPNSRLTTGCRPHPHQLAIHRAMTRHRFGVLVCHRRFGKTVAMVNQLIDSALRFGGSDAGQEEKNQSDGRFGYVAPYLKQAKEVTWDILKAQVGHLPGTVFVESELTVRFANGARIRLYGADNGDAIRGTYFDGVVLDEVADMRPEIWGSVIRPAIADRKGWVVFIGTPKGQNIFLELYQQALADPAWFAGLYRADETNLPWLSREECALARRTMSDAQYRQEFLCDFGASSDDVLISIDLVTEASARKVVERDIAGLPKIMGVDVARFGDDQSVIVERQGPAMIGKPKIFDNIDNMRLAGLVAEAMVTWRPDAVFIDGGRGEGVIDRLRQLGHEVIEVSFGGKALNPRFADKRSEMWQRMKDWLAEGGAIPNDAILKTDLSAPTYTFDAANHMKLERKEDIKKRLARSPDLADALALTFAEAVAPGVGAFSHRYQPDTIDRRLTASFTQHEYDPYGEH